MNGLIFANLTTIASAFNQINVYCAVTNLNPHLKPFYRTAVCLLFLLASVKQFAQHHSQMIVEVNSETKTLNIQIAYDGNINNIVIPGFRVSKIG